MNDGTTPPETPAAQAADRAFFDLLRRELEQRHQGAAAEHLRSLLKLRKVAEEPADDNTLVKFKLAQHLTDATVRLNAASGEVISWYIDFLSREGDESLAPEQALALAQETGQPPEDARLEVSGYDATGGSTVFRARWSHWRENIAVEGDFLEVLINGKVQKAFACTRLWRTANLTESAVER